MKWNGIDKCWFDHLVWSVRLWSAHVRQNHNQNRSSFSRIHFCPPFWQSPRHKFSKCTFQLAATASLNRFSTFYEPSVYVAIVHFWSIREYTTINYLYTIDSPSTWQRLVAMTERERKQERIGMLRLIAFKFLVFIVIRNCKMLSQMMRILWMWIFCPLFSESVALLCCSHWSTFNWFRTFTR